MQSRRDSKVITWNPRKPPNQRSCFLFQIEDYGKLLTHLPNGVGTASLVLARSLVALALAVILDSN